MAGKFDLESYETVETRLARFWEKHPKGRVLTDLVFHDERRFIIKAEIYFDRDDMTPVATGFAEEIVGASPVNRTSALENGETSAIGRALANCNFASQGKRPSREEMEKVERYKAEPRKPVTPKAPVTFTDEQIKTATTVADALNQTTEIELLREWYSANSAILEAPVYGSTLKDLFNKRVEELKS
jgi:hypothetical protein